MGTYTEQLEQVAGLSEDKLAQSELDSLEITDTGRTLDQMATRLRTIASDPGIRGEAGDAAWTALADLATVFNTRADELTQASTGSYDARYALRNARFAYEELPPAELDWWQKAAITAAGTAGGMVILGPLGAVTSGAATSFWLNQWDERREAAAKAAVDELNGEMAAAENRLPYVGVDENRPGGPGDSSIGTTNPNGPGTPMTPYSPVTGDGSSGGGSTASGGSTAGGDGSGSLSPDMDGVGPAAPNDSGSDGPGYPNYPGGPGYPGSGGYPGDLGHPGSLDPSMPDDPNRPDTSADGSVDGIIPGAGISAGGGGYGGGSAVGASFGGGAMAGGLGVGGAALGAAAAGRLSGGVSGSTGGAGGAGGLGALAPGAGATGGGAGGRGGIGGAMMGGGSGSGSKKKRRPGESLGLLADDLEDEDYNPALGAGAGAGSRDHALPAPPSEDDSTPEW